MQTLYDLLGALPNDDAGALRAAFRRAVKGAHPDIRPGDPDAARKIPGNRPRQRNSRRCRTARGLRRSLGPRAPGAGSDIQIRHRRQDSEAGLRGVRLRRRFGFDRRGLSAVHADVGGIGRSVCSCQRRHAGIARDRRRQPGGTTGYRGRRRTVRQAATFRLSRRDDRRKRGHTNRCGEHSVSRFRPVSRPGHKPRGMPEGLRRRRPQRVRRHRVGKTDRKGEPCQIGADDGPEAALRSGRDRASGASVAATAHGGTGSVATGGDSQPCDGAEISSIRLSRSGRRHRDRMRR